MADNSTVLNPNTSPATAKVEPSLPKPPAVTTTKAEAKLPAPPVEGSAAGAAYSTYREEFLKTQPDKALDAALAAFRNAESEEQTRRELKLSGASAWDLAAEQLDSFLRVNGEHPRAAEAKVCLGFIATQTGKWDTAEKYLRQYTASAAEQQSKPEHYEQASFRLGEAGYQLSRTDKAKLPQAEADLEACIRQFPQGAYTKYAQGFLGDVKRDLGKTGEAVAAYEAALAGLKDPAEAGRANQISFNLNLAKSRNGAQGAEQAIADLSAMVKDGRIAKPQEIAEARLTIGLSYLSLAEASQKPEDKAAHYASASTAFQDALQADPNWPQAAACRDSWASCQIAHARILSIAGKPDEAAALCSAVITDGDKVANKTFVNDANFVRGLVNYQRDKGAEAIHDLTAFTKAAPLTEKSPAELKADRTQALAVLAVLYTQQTPPALEKAAAELATLCRENSGSPLAVEAAKSIGAKAASADNWKLVSEALSPFAERLIAARDLAVLPLVEAKAKLNQPDAVELLTKFTAALKDDPTRAQKENDVVAGAWKTVRHLEASGKSAEAEQVMAGILAVYPHSAQAAARLWNDSTTMRASNPGRADALLEKVLSVSSEQSLVDDAHYQLARSNREAGKYDRARAHCQALAAHAGYGDDASAWLAESCLKLQDFAAARDNAAAYLDRFADGQSRAGVQSIFAEACRGLAKAFTAEGQHEPAIAELVKGVVRGGETKAAVLCVLDIADAQLALKNYNEAEKTYADVKGRYANRVDLCFEADIRRGQLIAGREGPAKALAYYKHLLSDDYSEANYPADKFKATAKLRTELAQKIATLETPAPQTAAK